MRFLHFASSFKCMIQKEQDNGCNRSSAKIVSCCMGGWGGPTLSFLQKVPHTEKSHTLIRLTNLTAKLARVQVSHYKYLSDYLNSAAGCLPPSAWDSFRQLRRGRITSMRGTLLSHNLNRKIPVESCEHTKYLST
uniref:Uncharacterized protein n=1 Tax=Sphaerodactylus townsendi TaxID=933632 RepID=A0ACB8FWM8_9SAUR